MSELANSLGIDGKKYLQIISNNDEKKFDKIINNNNTLQILSKIGLKMKCYFCQKEDKINIIYENVENIKEILECKYCKKLQSFKTLENIILLQVKNMINKYFLNAKKCMKCQTLSRLFLRKK